MRTTVDLPVDLLQAAKIRAAERGEKLKEFFARAIAHEIGVPVAKREGTRVRAPLVPSVHGPEVVVTNDDLATALSEEDAERYHSL